MDVEQLMMAGLVTKSGDKVKMLSAKDRRRERALKPDEVDELSLWHGDKRKTRTKKDALRCIRTTRSSAPPWMPAMHWRSAMWRPREAQPVSAPPKPGADNRGLERKLARGKVDGSIW